jgi:hypothetical protein
MWSIGLQAICFIIITALSVSQLRSVAIIELMLKGGYETTQNPAIGIATIPFIYLYFGFYVACWSTVAPMCTFHYCSVLPVDHSDASEILPTMLRSKGIAIYSTVQSVTVTYNQYVNPINIEAIGELG